MGGKGGIFDIVGVTRWGIFIAAAGKWGSAGPTRSGDHSLRDEVRWVVTLDYFCDGAAEVMEFLTLCVGCSRGVEKSIECSWAVLRLNVMDSKLMTALTSLLNALIRPLFVLPWKIIYLTF